MMVNRVQIFIRRLICISQPGVVPLLLQEELHLVFLRGREKEEWQEKIEWKLQLMIVIAWRVLLETSEDAARAGQKVNGEGRVEMAVYQRESRQLEMIVANCSALQLVNRLMFSDSDPIKGKGRTSGNGEVQVVMRC